MPRACLEFSRPPSPVLDSIAAIAIAARCIRVTISIDRDAVQFSGLIARAYTCSL